MAKRIGQVLERVRKDLTRIKHRLGTFNFASTVGPDGSADDDCASDLSAGIETRKAFKDELRMMLEQLANYVDAQYLGDYAILHNILIAAEVDACDNDELPQKCCPLIYREKFHYFTPVGDCLDMQAQACKDEHSGSAATVTVSSTGVVTTNDGKVPATSHSHNTVCNADLKIRKMVHLLKGDAYTLFHDIGPHLIQKATVTADAETTGVAAEVNTQSFVCPNSATATHSTDGTAVDLNTAKTVVYAILNDLGNGTNSTSTVTPPFPGYNPDKRRMCLPKHFKDMDCLASNTAVNNLVEKIFDGTFNSDSDPTLHPEWVAFVKEINPIANIEDEPDLIPVIECVVGKLHEVRTWQLKNDGEQDNITYVRDVSECNQAFHEEAFGELTSIDETELCTRYDVGKCMLKDLDDLYRESCCNKQNFFTDIAVAGCDW
jgi:hypothetical protein